jgi:hypothetical protein
MKPSTFSVIFLTAATWLTGVVTPATAQGLASERWNSTSGSTVELLREQINLRAANVTGTTTGGSAGVNVTDNYGLRLRGWVEAPVTADYTFFVSGDEHVELWLSPDDAPFDKEMLAFHRGATSLYQWNKHPSQRSRKVHLQQGQSYYIEALMKEATGGDHLSIGWAYPPAFGTATEQAWGTATGTWTADGENVDFSVGSGDLWNAADDGLFRYHSWTGDGEFITSISDMNNPHVWAKAGLMIRASAAANSRRVMVDRTGAGTMGMRTRMTDGGSCSSMNFDTPMTWLRLMRTGTKVVGSVSNDRVNWITINTIYFSSLPETILVGHAVSSNTGAAGTRLTGTLGPIEAYPLRASEVVLGTQLTPYSGHPDDADDDGLDDAFETDNSLDPAVRYGNNGPYGDPDSDGRNNLAEYQMGSDPNFAEAVGSSLTREKWRVLGKTTAELIAHNRFYEAPDEIELIAGIDQQHEPYGVAYGTRYRGMLVAQTTGLHRFWITATDQAELWLADGTIQPPGESQPLRNQFGKRRVAWLGSPGPGASLPARYDYDRQPSQRSGLIFLTEGQSYYFEVLHKCGAEKTLDHVSVAWQQPGAEREVIPADYFLSHMPSPADLDRDSLPNAWETSVGLDPAANGRFDRKQSQYGDWDADGLSNLQEYQFGTNPKAADTDGDGITDYNEIFVYQTNPLVSNIITHTVHTNPPTGQYQIATGAWTENTDGSITAVDRRGGIDYQLVVAPGQEGVFEIVVTGSAAGNPRPIETLPVSILLDGTRIASTPLVSTNGGSNTVRTLTPWLHAGTHTVTIFHDNFRVGLYLRLQNVVINRIGGTDLNENGIPDWAEEKSAEENRLTRAPATSLVSPAAIEGIAAWQLPVITLNSDPEQTVEVQPGIDTGFYADIPLSESAATTMEVAYAGGAQNQQHSIEWAAANLVELSTAVGTLHLRKNDSLRLDAWGGSTPAGTFTVSLNGTLLADDQSSTTHNSGSPLVHCFDSAGEHTLVATWDGQPYTLNVEVHAADFGDDLAVQTHFPRSWEIAGLDRQLLIDADSSLAFGEIATTAPAARKFTAGVTQAGVRQVIARLPAGADGSPGTIIARGTVNGFHVAWSDQTQDTSLVHVYADGSRLMHSALIVVGLPPGVMIRISLVFQGSMFPDGSRHLWLNSDDFDINGMAQVYVDMPGGTYPGMCNNITVFLTAP